MAAADGAREPLAARAVLRTSDANEAQHVVAGAYVPHRLRSSDALDARLNLVASARMTFGYLTYGATVELDVPPMVDWYHINLTLRGSTGVRHAGVDVRTSAGRSGVVLSPVGESVLRWSPDAAQFAVKIPVDVVRAQLSVLLRDAVETPPRFEPHLDLAVLGAGGIVPAARFLADQLGSGADLDERVREQAESFMLTQLLLGARHDYSERLESQAGAAGRLALDEAIDYIESFPDHVLGLAEVAAAAGTTASILRAAFEREMGTTVEAYVWGVRLSRVRAAVRAAGHGGVDVHSLGRRWRFRGPDHLRGVPGSVRRGPGPSQANRRRAGAAGRARRRRPQRTVGRSSPPGAKARGTRRRVGVKVIGTVA